MMVDVVREHLLGKIFHEIYIVDGKMLILKGDVIFGIFHNAPGESQIELVRGNPHKIRGFPIQHINHAYLTNHSVEIELTTDQGSATFYLETSHGWYNLETGVYAELNNYQLLSEEELDQLQQNSSHRISWF